MKSFSVDRRRFPRLPVSSSVQFRNVLKPDDSFIGSLVKDLSVGGVGLAAYTFIPKETRLVLLLSLPGLLRPIRTVGRVAWMQQRRLAETYNVGVQFIEVIPDDRERIAEYVEQGEE